MAAYLDNAKLEAAFTRWREDRAAHPATPFPLPTQIALAAIAICDGLLMRRNFDNYSFKDDMRQEALLSCVRWAHNFQPGKGSAFSYLTCICYSAFARVIEREKRQRTPGALAIGETLGKQLAAPAPDDADVSTFLDRFHVLTLSELQVLRVALASNVQGERWLTPKRRALLQTLGCKNREELLALVEHRRAKVAA